MKDNNNCIYNIMNKVKQFFQRVALRKLLGRLGYDYIEYANKKLKDNESVKCGYIIINIRGNKYFRNNYNKISDYFERKAMIIFICNVIIINLYESDDHEYIVNIENIKYQEKQNINTENLNIYWMKFGLKI